MATTAHPVPESLPSSKWGRCVQLESARRSRNAALLTLGLIVAGCDGPQSALDPRGHDAEKLAELFWVMSVASVVIWAVVMAIAVYAVRREGAPPPGSANLLIIGGGVIFSIAVIAAHLIYGFALMTSLRAYVGAG